MSSSTQSLKFLLDENVRGELFAFLKSKGLQVEISPKGAKDNYLAEFSKKKGLIFVTNDFDFSEYTSDEIYGVVLLVIPQNDSNTLQESFFRLISECKDFQGNLILLYPNNWEVIPFFEET